MKTLILGICLWLMPLFIVAQNSALETYLREALENNIALKQKELSYAKSLLALKEAKSLFLPTVSFNAYYARANGGRISEIPMGDLLSPVYNNLNLLNGQMAENNPAFKTLPSYQAIPNQQINFLRPTEQETKLRVVIPIFNAAIIRGQRIHEDLVQIEDIGIEVYKSELIKEVKTAYFNYLKAIKIEEALQQGKLLLDEQLRTSNSLYKNQRGTIDMVYAAEAEIKDVEKQIAEASTAIKISKAFFNFLLNKEFHAPIQVDETTLLSDNYISIDEALLFAMESRGEIHEMELTQKLYDKKVELEKSSALPKLNFIGDYGIQGTQYKFGSADDFAVAAINLQWDLFKPSNKLKVQQAEVDKHHLDFQIEANHQRIKMDVLKAFYELETAKKSIELREAQVVNAQKAFDIVNKKFKIGKANLIQITDARTRLSNSKQESVIAIYDYQIQLAHFEKSMGCQVNEN